MLCLARPNACAIPVAGVEKVPFDSNQVIGYKAGMRIVARLLALLPLLCVEGAWARPVPFSIDLQFFNKEPHRAKHER
jgi:hypothetical protein